MKQVSNSEYEDFLDWKNSHTPKVGRKEKAEKQDVVLEMQELPREEKRAPMLSHSGQSRLGESMKDLDEQASKDTKFLKLAEGRTTPPVDSFAWRNVTMEVPLKAGGVFGFFEHKTGEYRKILDSVSGFVLPGEVLYIMGPSGAGKSTMLDALADRVKTRIEGVQWLNGELKTELKLKEVSKYVQQEESLLGALTVREVFQTAAAFYQPEVAKRNDLVESVAVMLGLTEQLETKIGDVFFRGLSGGQKRRVSVGIELIAQPSMLFLDEPTSGLDSASAFSIVSSLRRFAKATKTPLLMTIHQPSELLFELGDKLLLLAGGKQVYFGPLGELEGYFNNLGFHCPPRTSIAEWLLDLVNKDFGETEVVDRCVKSWPGSHLKSELDRNLAEIGVPQESMPVESSLFHTLPYRTSQLTQAWALFVRGFKNALRSPAVIWLRMAMYLMLSILIGTIWLQLGTSAKQIPNYNGMLFYTTAFFIFMSISVLPMYLEERAVFIRERGNSSYGVISYLLAHLCFELPFVFLLSLVCSSVVYWLVGLVADGSKFFIFVANLFMGLMVAESMMVLISAIVPYFIVGIAAGAFAFGAFMCVMVSVVVLSFGALLTSCDEKGFFVAFENIGWWWKWMRYIAVHYYNFSTLMTNQYQGLTLTASCEVPGQFPCYPSNVNGDDIIKFYDLESRLWVNFVLQIVMIIFYRVCAGLYLHFFVRGKK